MTASVAARIGSKSNPVVGKKIAPHKPVVRPAVNLQRAKRLIQLKIECVGHPAFRHPEYVESLEALQLPLLQNREATVGPLAGYLSGLYEVDLLTGLQEEQLFAQMNLLKFQAQQLQAELDECHPSVRTMNAMERYLGRANDVRNHLVRANLRLVMALAKKFAVSPSHLEELVSDGHLPLIRSVELFDFSRGYRFSTYATWAVRNHFLRSRQEDARYQERFHDGTALTLDHALDPRNSWQTDESQRIAQQTLVENLLSQLTDRERVVLSSRFGLNGQRAEQTLAEIGKQLGLSKERIRQVAAKALEKLGNATNSTTVTRGFTENFCD